VGKGYEKGRCVTGGKRGWGKSGKRWGMLRVGKRGEG